MKPPLKNTWIQDTHQKLHSTSHQQGDVPWYPANETQNQTPCPATVMLDGTLRGHIPIKACHEPRKEARKGGAGGIIISLNDVWALSAMSARDNRPTCDDGRWELATTQKADQRTRQTRT